MTDTRPTDVRTARASAPVLFYDGECGLCARSVQWCLARDRAGVLRFAPLQGTTYAALGEDRPRDLGSLVVHDVDGLHVRSEAVLRIGRLLGGPWRVAAALGRVVPRFARDAAYDAIARRRHRWFGPADACRVPDPATRARFLP